MPTPQGEAKGLYTIGKRAQLKSRRKRTSKNINASSPSTNAFLPIFLSSMQHSPWKHGNKNWVVSSPLLVMHE
jgi:hypothetical protein